LIDESVIIEISVVVIDDMDIIPDMIYWIS
jgi:hypothetical protein